MKCELDPESKSELESGPDSGSKGQSEEGSRPRPRIRSDRVLTAIPVIQMSKDPVGTPLDRYFVGIILVPVGPGTAYIHMSVAGKCNKQGTMPPGRCCAAASMKRR